MPSFQRLKNTYKHIPNVISLSRVIFGILLINSLIYGEVLKFWFSLALTVISDALDGFLARKLNAVSDLGKILDHIIDKGIILSSSFVLSSLYGLPFWVFFLLVFREMVTILVAIYVRMKKGYFPSSNPLGKLFGISSTLVLITYFYDLDVKLSVLALAITFLFVSSLANLVSLRT